VKAKNVIDLLRKAHPGRRYFANPNYPFIPMVSADTEYWAKRGWEVSDTGRAVRRIKQ
jgi:hypothetical protein